VSAGTTLVVLTSEPKGPVVRRRVEAYREALARQGVAIEVVAWPKNPIARLQAIGRAKAAGNALVCSRLLSVRDVFRLRRAVRRLLFDFDDALPFRDTFRGATRSRTRTRRFRAVVAASDAVSAGNPYLAGLAAEAGAKAVVVPTVVDVAEGPPEPEPPPPPNVLGWIGSRATVPYLRAKTIPLAAVVASGFPFRLRVVADVIPVMPPGIPVEHVPWAVEVEAPALDGMQVGVAPLPDDPWTRGKCGLKVVQMLARGRPVVASPVGVQSRQVRHGETGFLARTPEEWVEALTELFRDGDRRRRMGAAAKEDVRARWSVAAWTPAFCRHVAEALA
jgi:hypothetical protein